MAKAAASAEPSMEEILASIRRIISDESEPKGPAAASEPAPAQPVEESMSSGASMSQDDLDKLFGGGDEPEPAAPAAEEEVLDLGAVATVEDEPIGLVEGLKPGEADLAFVDPEPEAEEMDMAALMAAEARAAAAAPAPEPEPEPVVVEPVRRVRPQAVERDDEQLLSEATGATVNAAFGQLSHTILSANAKTLDDLVKEMLRPMLRHWLDENLPAIVERLVRAEIERVSRGR